MPFMVESSHVHNPYWVKLRLNSLLVDYLALGAHKKNPVEGSREIPANNCSSFNGLFSRVVKLTSQQTYPYLFLWVDDKAMLLSGIL